MKAAPIAALLVLFAGCGGSQSRQHEAVRRMHAAQTGCPFDQVQASVIERRAWVAWGCDTQGAYICDRRYVCRLDGTIARAR